MKRRCKLSFGKEIKGKVIFKKKTDLKPGSCLNFNSVSRRNLITGNFHDNLISCFWKDDTSQTHFLGRYLFFEISMEQLYCLKYKRLNKSIKKSPLFY
jgi:hypothetical protein